MAIGTVREIDSLEVRGETFRVYVTGSGQFKVCMDGNVEDREAEWIAKDSLAKLRDAISSRMGASKWNVPLIKRLVSWQTDQVVYRRGVIEGRHSNGNLLIRFFQDEHGRAVNVKAGGQVKGAVEQGGRSVDSRHDRTYRGDVDLEQLEALFQAVTAAEKALAQFQEENRPQLPEAAAERTK